MEKALLINNPQQLNRLAGFSRIYYGAEFCQNKIPEPDILKKVYSAAKRYNKEFTLLTPYVTTQGLAKLEPLLRYLDEQNNRTEVVFNDWGVLKLIRERRRNIQPVLGRLLTKQRRDPRAHDILLNKQVARKLFDHKTKETFIVFPKKIPPSLYEHFKASIINVSVFHDFLLANGIRRLEIDNLVWDIKIEVPPSIGISIYLPYNYVSTTRLCGLLNLSYSVCKKECQKYYLTFKSDASSVPFYIKGNTVFYKAKIPSKKYLEEKQINRIIWEPEIPN